LGYPQHHTPLKVADKPAGEWNHFEIEVENGLVTVHLNGELVLDQLECKFSKPAGPLVLQHHGTPLWFKNIRTPDIQLQHNERFHAPSPLPQSIHREIHGDKQPEM
jgi:hypothetical protein